MRRISLNKNAENSLLARTRKIAKTLETITTGDEQ